MANKLKRPLGMVSTLALVSLLAASVGLALLVRSGVRSEQRQLLSERTTEAGLVVGSLFNGFGADLSVLATTTRPRMGSTDSFTTSAKPLLGDASEIGVLQISSGTARVLAAVGSGPAAGTVVTGPRADLAVRALASTGMVTSVFAEGHGRQLHFALATKDGLVVYETESFDLSQPYVTGATGPFSDLQGALYASSAPASASLVLATTRSLPLRGGLERQSVDVGADHWLIVTKSHGPLVGAFASSAQWWVLGAGLLAALLATVLVETVARRRRYALALVDERTVALREALEEQARLERGAHEARQVAEAANRSKSEFLSRMSHELRTPLNAVLGFGQLLELDELDAAQQESVSQIVKGGRHLLGLINDVLDISRIETGNMAMSPEPVLAAELINETSTLMQPLAAAHGMRIDAGSAQAIGNVHVLADRQRLKQILLNLMSNAVKYNRAGGVVTVSADATDRLRITIADTGPGIPSEDLDRLFVPFERLGAERTDVEGTGVGLALSRRLAEAMGGTISVVSNVGVGSEFTVELPLAESPLDRYDRITADADDDSPAHRAAPRRKVLYIEDNTSNVRLVERVLERRPDLEVVSAMQGRLGLALAHEHQPVLILLDLHLPDVDGEEILRELRHDRLTVDTPVVVLSADATTRQIDRLLAMGATAYLTKPLDVHEFLNVLDRVMGSEPVAAND